MKRKINLGITLAVLTFVLSNLVIFKNIQSIAEYQKIKNDHQVIMTMYLEVLSSIQNTQINLYQYKSGIGEELDSIVNDVRHSDELILKIRNNYSNRKNRAICNQCHDANQKIEDLSNHLSSHLETFKETTSSVIVSRNKPSMDFHRDEAIAKGDNILQDINNLWFKTVKMNEKMQIALEEKQLNSEFLIGVSSILSTIVLLIIMFTTGRSITSPINKLVTSMQTLGKGNFDLKLDVVSDDEFGFLAKNFNTMSDDLKKTIGERDAAKQELEELNRSLEQRILQKTEKLKEAHENLARTEGLAIAGTVASSVAHELSTPLSTLMGYCQLINSRLPEGIELTKYCNLMEGEIERCSHIMRGMLNLVRISDEEKSSIDVNAMITEILLVVSLQANCKNVSIKDYIDPRVPHVMANAIGLRQVFMNIIINALEAMPDGGKLCISTSVADSGTNVVVSISDTGHGISERDMSKIFKSFYTTKKTGTGLGLSISYGIIKGHNGHIAVRSEIGKGTTFDIFLPVQVK